MARGLDAYRDKRDFGRTPEPPPDFGRAGGRGRRPPIFVVHRHEASRLHWDLRLEMDGALRSWAVPKGFCYDPRVKHLAVRTEDHPLAYEDFRGWIPPGEYGAGRMEIWDRGTFVYARPEDGPDVVESGELKVLLRGRRLRGEWHLVKTKQGPDTWLCFKSKDRYAGPERDSALGADLAGAREKPAPRQQRLARASGARAPFEDPAWLFEVELPGERVLVDVDGDAVRRTPRGSLGAGLERELTRLRARRARLDAVLVALDERGRPDLRALAAWRAGANEPTLALYAFDLLQWEDYDLRPLPLLERKRALRGMIPGSASAVRYLEHVLGDAPTLANAAANEGLTTLVAKRADAPYRGGARPEWLRVPLEARPAPAGRRPKSRVTFTNLDKVFWPAEGYTKGDLVGYYQAVADVLLPHIADRAVHLVRYPDGIEGKNFYQRHPPEGAPAWLTTPELAGGDGEVERHLVLDRVDALLWAANAGAIELHPWMSRVASDAEPDVCVLDLDAKQATWHDVVAVARRAGGLLRELGLRPLVKTSGKTGLHVVVPLAPGYTYDQSRMFCEGVARVLARELAEVATVERIPAKRGPRVYLDFGQNGRGQTVVAPYSVRPVPGATVSAPLDWAELEDDPRREAFTLRTMPARLAERGDLFAPVLTDRQDLRPAIERLADRARRPG